MSIAEPEADVVIAGRVDAKRKQYQLVLNVGRPATHEALHGIDGALGLREQAAAGGFANDNASVGIETDDRGAKRIAVRTRDAFGLARRRIRVCDEAVGGAEIDSYDPSHGRAE